MTPPAAPLAYPNAQPLSYPGVTPAAPQVAPPTAPAVTPDPGADLWHKNSSKPLVEIHRKMDRMMDDKRYSVLDRIEKKYGEKWEAPKSPSRIPQDTAKPAVEEQPAPAPETEKPKVVFKPKPKPKMEPPAKAEPPLQTETVSKAATETEVTTQTRPEVAQEQPSSVKAAIEAKVKAKQKEKKHRMPSLGGFKRRPEPRPLEVEQAEPAGHQSKTGKVEEITTEKPVRSTPGIPRFGSPDTSRRKRLRLFGYMGKNHPEERKIVKDHIASLEGKDKLIVQAIDGLGWIFRVAKVPYRGIRKYAWDPIDRRRAARKAQKAAVPDPKENEDAKAEASS